MNLTELLNAMKDRRVAAETDYHHSEDYALDKIYVKIREEYDYWIAFIESQILEDKGN